MIKQVGEKYKTVLLKVSRFRYSEGVQFLGTWSPETPEEAKAAVIEDENKLKSGEMVIEDATHNL